MVIAAVQEGKDGSWARGLAMEMGHLKEHVIEKHKILLIASPPM